MLLLLQLLKIPLMLLKLLLLLLLLLLWLVLVLLLVVVLTSVGCRPLACDAPPRRPAASFFANRGSEDLPDEDFGKADTGLAGCPAKYTGAHREKIEGVLRTQD